MRTREAAWRPGKAESFLVSCFRASAARLAVVTIAALLLSDGLHAQQMPDPSQMAGRPLPAPELSGGTVSVRLFRERVGNNIANHPVTLSGMKSGPTTVMTVEDPWAAQRERMVREQIESRGVRDPATLAAMRAVPRHLFVPGEYRSEAYGDHPLAIGEGQTISQPYIVAFMTERLDPKPTDRILSRLEDARCQLVSLDVQIRLSVYDTTTFNPSASASPRLNGIKRSVTTDWLSLIGITR
jgi:hypothetical protein